MITTANNHSTRLVIVGDYLFDPGVGLISGPSGAHYVCPHLAETLSVMVENAGGVVKHEDLANWQQDSGRVDEQVLGRNVTRLKQYFRDCGLPPAYIETVPNQGYRLIAPVYGLTDKPVLEPKPGKPAATHRPGRLIRLINEFRERKVCRAMLIYSAVVWLIYEFTDLVIPALGLPDWVLTLVVLLGLLGFPIALMLSWVFDLTPEGLVREPPKRTDCFPRRKTDVAVDFALIAAAIAICTMLVVSTQAGDAASEAKADTIEDVRAGPGRTGGNGEALGQVFHEAA